MDESTVTTSEGKSQLEAIWEEQIRVLSQLARSADEEGDKDRAASHRKLMLSFSALVEKRKGERERLEGEIGADLQAAKRAVAFTKAVEDYAADEPALMRKLIEEIDAYCKRNKLTLDDVRWVGGQRSEETPPAGRE